MVRVGPTSRGLLQGRSRSPWGQAGQAPQEGLPGASFLPGGVGQRCCAGCAGRPRQPGAEGSRGRGRGGCHCPRAGRASCAEPAPWRPAWRGWGRGLGSGCSLWSCPGLPTQPSVAAAPVGWDRAGTVRLLPPQSCEAIERIRSAWQRGWLGGWGALGHSRGCEEGQTQSTQSCAGQVGAEDRWG